MKKLLLFVICFFCLIPVLYSQALKPWRYDPSAGDLSLWNLRRYEFTVGMGMSQLFGDIGGFSPSLNLLGIKDMTLNHIRLNLYSSFKYRITDDISARFNLALGYFHSTDERGSNPDRGFESTTIFTEPSLMAEYHFFLYTGPNKTKIRRPSSGQTIFSKIDLYLFTGLGGISYNIIPNEKLEPLVEKKIRFSAVVPLGIGANLIYSRSINIGLELEGRYAFTDYLDGYTSQYSKFNDIYYLLNLTLTYKIRTGSNGLPFFK